MRNKQGSSQGMLKQMLVNMLSQQINRCCTLPLEVIANANQADKQGRSAWHTISTVWARDGLLGFWKGLGISLVLSLNPALMFTLVDKFTLATKKIFNTNSVSAAQMFQVYSIESSVHYSYVDVCYDNTHCCFATFLEKMTFLINFLRFSQSQYNHRFPPSPRRSLPC